MSENQHRYALKPGHKIHWYEVQRILGKGGFGITYEARDINLAKPVAIKEFLPSEFAIREADDSVHPVSDESQGMFSWGLDRFISEARILSSFEHPNIVKVHAVFEENNTGYMVMAFEKGKSFKSLLKEKKTLDEKTLLDLFLPIIDGLEQVHEKNFIHRDIKPDNIYVRENGSAVLLDFGSARQAVEGGNTMTSLVSPGYAPFEQYYPKGEEQGPWTDIYGLGATLYHAVTGKKPMDAVYRSRAILDDGQNAQASAAELAKGDYSQSFLAAIDAALEFKPSDRPQSLAQWREQLTSTAPLKAKQNGNKKSLVVPAIIGVATLAAMSSAGYLLWPSDTDPTSPALVTNDVQQNSEKPVTVTNELQAPDNAKDKQADAELLAQIEAEKAQLKAERIAAEQAEAKRQEEERLRQQAAAEAKRIAEEKRKQEQQRIAEQKRLAEEKRQREMEKRIQASKQEFASRLATKFDVFPYRDYSDAKPLTNQHPTATYRVNASTKQWLNAGVTIERGQSYRITASGEWSMGHFCNPSDANGAGIYTIGCWDGGKQTVAGYSHGALIGKIGKETLAFYVGTEFEFTAGSTGTLYFMSNDAPAFISDNKGDLTVTIERLKP